MLGSRWPLKLIVGPPNSGRTGAILEAFRGGRGARPGAGRADRGRRRALRARADPAADAVIGALGLHLRPALRPGRARHRAPAGPALSRTQRRRLAREAVARAELRAARAPRPQRPGFPAALDDADLRAAGRAASTPRRFASARAEAGRVRAGDRRALRRLRRASREELGRHDDHSLAARRDRGAAGRARTPGAPARSSSTASTTSPPSSSSWCGARGAAEVTVALPCEDRAVLTAARGALFAELRDVAGGSRSSELRGRAEATPRSGTLFELERRFGEPPAPSARRSRTTAASRCSPRPGELAEAEAIGARGRAPARTTACRRRRDRDRRSATRPPPGRSTAGCSAASGSRSRSRPISPVDRHRRPARGWSRLLEAAVGRGGAEDLLAYLRTPGDRLARRGRLARAPDAARGACGRGRGARRLGWRGRERRRGLLASSSGCARPGRGRAAARGRPAGALDRRVGRPTREAAVAGPRTARSSCGPAPRSSARSASSPSSTSRTRPADVIAAVGRSRCRCGAGPTAGRVRVISPYRARARRVAAPVRRLAPGRRLPAPRHRRAAALRRRARGAGAAAARRRPRSRTATCSRSASPGRSERLWLSWRSADDEGGATARSPFVDEVARAARTRRCPTASRSATRRSRAEAGGRGLAESVVPRRRAAPSERELARAPRPRSTGCGRPARRSALRARAAAARAGARADAGDGAVRPLDARGVRRLPLPLVRRPRAEAAADRPRGRAAERRLGRPPGARAPLRGAARRGAAARRRRPWRDWSRARRRAGRRARAERAARASAPTPPRRSRRVEGLVLAFLARRGRTPSRAFRPDAGRGELRLRGLREGRRCGSRRRRSRPDRPGRPRPRAARRWSRTTSPAPRSTAARGCSSGGKLQLQLYMLAARELWGLELAGGLYRPLGGTEQPRAARACCASRSEDDLAGLDPRPKRPPLRRGLRAGAERRRGRERARSSPRSSAGDDRPRADRADSCPEYCTFQPICRRERGLPEEEPRSTRRTRSEPAPDRPSSSRRSPSATATSSCGPAPGPGRPRCWSTASARRRSTPRPGSSGSSPSPSPSAPPTSCAAASARSCRRAREADGEELEPLRERRRHRARLDLDHPRLLPAAARLPPGGGRDRPSLPRRSTSPRRTASPRAPSTPRWRSWSTEGEAEALELAAREPQRHPAGDDPRRLRRAPQPRRSRAGAARPARRRTRRRDRRAGRGAEEAQAECAEATGSKGEISERIAEAAELDPESEPGEALLERLAALQIASGGRHFEGEACERYKRALKRARSAVAARVLAPAYEQLRELVTGFGGATRS